MCSFHPQPFLSSHSLPQESHLTVKITLCVWSLWRPWLIFQFYPCFVTHALVSSHTLMRRQIWTILKEPSTCWSRTLTPPGPCLREYFTRSLSGLYLHNCMLGSEGKSSPQIVRVSKLQQSMFYCVLEKEKKKTQIIQLALNSHSFYHFKIV